MKKILMCLVFIFFLTACGADPRKEALAFETRTEAEQAALDAQQARGQSAKMNEFVIQDAQRKQEIKDATLENAKAVSSFGTRWVGFTIAIVLMFVIVSTGRSVSTTIEGFGEAAVRAAMVKANLIYLDKATGTYPQLLEYIGAGKYSLTDLNDHSTRLLDTHNEADLLAVKGAMAIRYAMVLSNAAARSKDPAGVSMIQPLVIDQEAS